MSRSPEARAALEALRIAVVGGDVECAAPWDDGTSFTLSVCVRGAEANAHVFLRYKHFATTGHTIMVDALYPRGRTDEVPLRDADHLREHIATARERVRSFAAQQAKATKLRALKGRSIEARVAEMAEAHRWAWRIAGTGKSSTKVAVWIDATLEVAVTVPHKAVDATLAELAATVQQAMRLSALGARVETAWHRAKQPSVTWRGTHPPQPKR